MSDTQISAFISTDTKRLVEQYAEAHGVKKGHLIEQALLHHLQALRELPADLVIPAKIVVSQSSMETIIKARRKRPTKAMRDLLNGKPVAGEPEQW